MRHAIAESIVENGQIQYVDCALPKGRIHVHLVYDTQEKSDTLKPVLDALKKTAEIYKNINPDKAARSLCDNWERVYVR